MGMKTGAAGPSPSLRGLDGREFRWRKTVVQGSNRVFLAPAVCHEASLPAFPGDPPGELEVVDGLPEGGKKQELTGMASAFATDYAPEEMFDIAKKLYKASK